MTRQQLKAQSKAMLQGRWNKLALCSLLFFLICSIFSGETIVTTTQNAMQNSGFSVNLSFWNPLRPWFTLVYVVCRILCAFVLFGYQDQFLKTRVGAPVSAKSMCKRFAAMPGKIVLWAIISLTIQIVFSLVYYGLVAFIGEFAAPLLLIIGLVELILTLRLAMAPIILLENPYTTVPAAFIQSYNVMRGNTWKYFALNLSFIGWILLGLCTFGIGLFWVMPYYCMTNVNFYYNIKATKLHRP